MIHIDPDSDLIVTRNFFQWVQIKFSLLHEESEHSVVVYTRLKEMHSIPLDVATVHLGFEISISL